MTSWKFGLGGINSERFQLSTKRQDPCHVKMGCRNKIWDLMTEYNQRHCSAFFLLLNTWSLTWWIRGRNAQYS